jgi:Domain of unknown function (DUF1127)
MFDAPRKGPSTWCSKPGRKNGCERLSVRGHPLVPTTDLMDTTMCRIDEQDFPIDPRQLTLEEWQNFKRRVTERAQQDRQQVLRAAAIALPRALLAGACYGGSLLARIAGKAYSAYALRREWRAVVRALDDRMLRDIGLGRSGDRIRNLRQRSRERISGTH